MRTRPLRLFAGAVAAMAAAGMAVLVFASPASAWTVMVSGTAVCDPKTGAWEVTWTLENDQKTAATLSNVRFTPTVAAASLPTTVPPKQGTTNGHVETVVTLPTNVATWDEASLTFTARWSSGETHRAYGKVQRQGECRRSRPAAPDVDFAPSCDGTTTVRLANGPDSDEPAEFVVVGSNDFRRDEKLPAGTETEVLVPAANGPQVTVTSDEETWEFTWKRPDDCATPSPPEPSEPPQQGPPQLPQTGFPVRQVISVAILLVAFGAGAIILTPRRRLGLSRK